MKVLYLTDAERDYLADQIHDGLCAVLGRDYVIDFPRKELYHRSASKQAGSVSQAELTIDGVASLIREGNIDLVVVSSPRAGAVRACLELAGLVSLPPVVFLDGEDDRQIRDELSRSLGAGLYFKREFPLNAKPPGASKRRSDDAASTGLGNRLYPLSFSVTAAELEPLPNSARDVDVSFVGRASHRKRVRAVKLLTGAPDIRFEGGIYAEPTDRSSKLTDSWFGIIAAKLRGDPPGQGSSAKLGREAYRSLLARSKTACASSASIRSTCCSCTGRPWAAT